MQKQDLLFGLGRVLFSTVAIKSLITKPFPGQLLVPCRQLSFFSVSQDVAILDWHVCGARYCRFLPMARYYIPFEGTWQSHRFLLGDMVAPTLLSIWPDNTAPWCNLEHNFLGDEVKLVEVASTAYLPACQCTLHKLQMCCVRFLFSCVLIP